MNNIKSTHGPAFDQTHCKQVEQALSLRLGFLCGLYVRVARPSFQVKPLGRQPESIDMAAVRCFDFWNREVNQQYFATPEEAAASYEEFFRRWVKLGCPEASYQNITAPQATARRRAFRGA